MDGGPREQHAKVSHKRPRGSSTTPQQKNKGKLQLLSSAMLLINLTSA